MRGFSFKQIPRPILIFLLVLGIFAYGIRGTGEKGWLGAVITLAVLGVIVSVRLVEMFRTRKKNASDDDFGG
jgi:hypothetical protein